MANSSVAFGFMPYGRLGGGSPTEELERTWIHSSDAQMYFTGDLVARSTDGNAIDLIDFGSTSARVPWGVFWGCKYYSAAAQRVIWSRYYPGSVGADATATTEAYLITDPNTLFRCVGGTSAAGATFVNGDIGANTVILTSQSSYGNTATGQSAMMLSTSFATSLSSGGWFRIIDLYVNRVGPGAPGADAAAYNQVIVRPNSWEQQQGTVGVSS